MSRGEMNRGDIKLIVDRCIAYDVPDAADLIESLVQQLANKDVTHLKEMLFEREKQTAQLGNALHLLYSWASNWDSEFMNDPEWINKDRQIVMSALNKEEVK